MGSSRRRPAAICRCRRRRSGIPGPGRYRRRRRHVPGQPALRPDLRPPLAARRLGDLRAAAAPGAAGSLLRANAFFDGTGAPSPALTLAAGVAFGLLVILVADRRGLRSSRPVDHN